MSNFLRDHFLLVEPATSSPRPAPGLQLLVPAPPPVILEEQLLDLVVPLGEGLVHADMGDGNLGEGADARTALEHRGEADTAEAGAVEVTVRGGALKVDAVGGLRVDQDHLLHLLHHQVKVEVAGHGDGEALHELIDEHFLCFLATLGEDLDAEVRGAARGHHRL